MNEKLNTLLNEYEEKLNEDFHYTKNAISTRKSSLKRIISEYFNNDIDKFNKALSSRKKYNSLINEIVNNNNELYKGKLLNALSRYLLIKNITFDEDNIINIIRNYAKTIKELLSYSDIIRTGNIVGEYAEYLCEKYLDIERVKESTKDVDGKKDGKTFQIKSRWIHTGKNGEDEFGIIHFENNQPSFDYFIGIIFDCDLKINKVIVIDRDNLITLFSNINRKTKKIKVSDIFDKNGNIKHNIELCNEFDKDIKIMIKEINSGKNSN